MCLISVLLVPEFSGILSLTLAVSWQLALLAGNDWLCCLYWPLQSLNCRQNTWQLLYSSSGRKRHQSPDIFWFISSIPQAVIIIKIYKVLNCNLHTAQICISDIWIWNFIKAYSVERFEKLSSNFKNLSKSYEFCFRIMFSGQQKLIKHYSFYFTELIWVKIWWVKK